MKPRPAIPCGPYLVVGLARSGIAAALALADRGELVAGVDAGAPDVASLRERGIEVQLGSDGLALLDGVGCLLKSPGVPAQAAVVEAARARGIEVIGELELAWRLLPNEFIAVTGTNGKTTTVELLGHIHRCAGIDVAVAGNVGTALSGLVGRLPKDAVVVCEASSFQLEDSSELAPEAAVLLNITPDHLDRHGTLDAYRDAKLAVFAHQGEGDVAVLPIGQFDEAAGGAARRVRFAREVGDSPPTAAQMRARDGALWWQGERLLALDELRLRGAHNVENSMAAAAVMLARGVDVHPVCEGLRTFTGVAHRLEQVACHDGVSWVNDSKATNVASTVVALASFDPHTVHLILGGVGKDQDFTPLRDAVDTACVAVYLIGEDAPAIERALAGSGVPLLDSGDLDHAVVTARGAAYSGDTVLLSPACASFDQFVNYEARGDRFRELAVGS